MSKSGPINFPTPQPITSDALTVSRMSQVMQYLVMSALGIDPGTDPQAYYKVRTTYPTGGAPAWKVAEDVAFVTPIPVDDDYNRVRDEAMSAYSSTQVEKTITYTRVWKVTFCIYGPNSLDNLRAIRSGVLEQSLHDFLAGEALYLVPDNAEPVRNPELFDGNWWERVDGELRFNELVTETTIYTTVKSVEAIVADSNGQLADITVSN